MSKPVFWEKIRKNISIYRLSSAENITQSAKLNQTGSKAAEATWIRFGIYINVMDPD